MALIIHPEIVLVVGRIWAIQNYHFRICFPLFCGIRPPSPPRPALVCIFQIVLLSKYPHCVGDTQSHILWANKGL